MDEFARTLWVGNLPREVDVEILYELFLQSGPLEKVIIPKEKKTTIGWYGFVTFKHECSVTYAIALLNGTTLFNQKLKLQYRSASKFDAPQQIPRHMNHHRSFSLQDHKRLYPTSMDSLMSQLEWAGLIPKSNTVTQIPVPHMSQCMTPQTSQQISQHNTPVETLQKNSSHISLEKQQISHEISSEIPQQIPCYISSEKLRRMSWHSPSDMPQFMSTHMPQCIPQFPSTHMLQHVPQFSNTYMPQHIPQFSSTYMPQHIPQFSSTYMPQHIPQFYTDHIPHQIPQHSFPQTSQYIAPLMPQYQMPHSHHFYNQRSGGTPQDKKKTSSDGQGNPILTNIGYKSRGSEDKPVSRENNSCSKRGTEDRPLSRRDESHNKRRESEDRSVLKGCHSQEKQRGSRGRLNPIPRENYHLEKPTDRQRKRKNDSNKSSGSDSRKRSNL